MSRPGRCAGLRLPCVNGAAGGSGTVVPADETRLTGAWGSMKETQLKVRLAVASGLGALGLATLVACSTDSTVAQSAVVTSAARVGSEQCATCHRDETKTWKDTYHAKVAQPPHEALVREAKQYWDMDGKGNAGPTKGNVDGKGYGLADVQLVVGTRWKQRFLVKNETTGHHQFLDKQWNSYTRRWEEYANLDDWEGACATCHPPADKPGSSAVVDRPGVSSGDL
jgi:cytochrome c553